MKAIFGECAAREIGVGAGPGGDPVEFVGGLGSGVHLDFGADAGGGEYVVFFTSPVTT